MKKRPTSGKARSSTGWHKHLDKEEQRRANRGTRQAFKQEDKTVMSKTKITDKTVMSKTKITDKKVNLNLVGLDGNAFALLGAFGKQAREDGWTKEEIDAVRKEATSGDYSHLLCTLMDYCEVQDDDFGDEEMENAFN